MQMTRNDMIPNIVNSVWFGFSVGISPPGLTTHGKPDSHNPSTIRHMNSIQTLGAWRDMDVELFSL